MIFLNFFLILLKCQSYMSFNVSVFELQSSNSLFSDFNTCGNHQSYNTNISLVRVGLTFISSLFT